MGKILALLILAFIVLLALRVIGMRKARERRRAAAPPEATTGKPMVRCVRCGVFLPRSDAKTGAGGYTCPDGQCLEKR